MALRKAIVVVAGYTGVGKSKLAIEIARRFNGEIVSTDSMQIYKGLDIVTNKVTAEEMAAAPHHCIGFVSPFETFDVALFQEHATRIDDIHARGKLPILVGGTNFYMESLLFRRLYGELKPPESGASSDEMGAEPEPAQSGASDSLSLHDKLKLVDPVMAERLHPNDTRKIARSLAIFKEQGVPHSTLLLRYNEQHNPFQLRYDPSICCFLDSKLETLDPRLDSRVDAMIASGLLQELKDFHTLLHEHEAAHAAAHTPAAEGTAAGCSLDFTRGILQSIGFKEFQPFFALLHQQPDVALVMDASAEGRLLRACVDQMKLNTRRYARKQAAWLRTRILRVPDLRVVRLEADDPKLWDTKVHGPAMEAVGALLAGNKVDTYTLAPPQPPQLATWKKYTCEQCNKTLNGDHEWEVHLRSRSHTRRNNKRARAKREDERRAGGGKGMAGQGDGETAAAEAETCGDEDEGKSEGVSEEDQTDKAARV